MIDLITIAVIFLFFWAALRVLGKARERKEKITWREKKAFLDEIDRLNGR